MELKKKIWLVSTHLVTSRSRKKLQSSNGRNKAFLSFFSGAFAVSSPSRRARPRGSVGFRCAKPSAQRPAPRLQPMLYITNEYASGPKKDSFFCSEELDLDFYTWCCCGPSCYSLKPKRRRPEPSCSILK